MTPCLSSKITSLSSITAVKLHQVLTWSSRNLDDLVLDVVTASQELSTIVENIKTNFVAVLAIVTKWHQALRFERKDSKASKQLLFDSAGCAIALQVSRNDSPSSVNIIRHPVPRLC